MTDLVAPTLFERYLAVDLHKDYVVVGGVNARLEVVLSPRRIELEAWPRWAQANLHKTDALVVESTSNAWDFYDGVAPLVGQAVKQSAWSVFAARPGKTDKPHFGAKQTPRHRLHSDRWVPPDVREARGRWRIGDGRCVIARWSPIACKASCTAHRLARGRTSAPPTDRGGTLPVSPTEQLRVRQDWPRWSIWLSRSSSWIPKSCG
jgi:hypothetical protein